MTVHPPGSCLWSHQTCISWLPLSGFRRYMPLVVYPLSRALRQSLKGPARETECWAVYCILTNKGFRDRHSFSPTFEYRSITLTCTSNRQSNGKTYGQRAPGKVKSLLTMRYMCQIWQMLSSLCDVGSSKYYCEQNWTKFVGNCSRHYIDTQRKIL